MFSYVNIYSNFILRPFFLSSSIEKKKNFVSLLPSLDCLFMRNIAATSHIETLVCRFYLYLLCYIIIKACLWTYPTSLSCLSWIAKRSFESFSLFNFRCQLQTHPHITYSHEYEIYHVCLWIHIFMAYYEYIWVVSLAMSLFA